MAALHLVFEVDAAIVGFAILSSVDTPVVSLDHFAVAEKRRGYGLPRHDELNGRVIDLVIMGRHADATLQV